MTRRRWIADEVSGNRAALTGSHAEHLARVLRARIGQEFDIATGSNIRRGRITSIDNDRVEFELGEHIPAVAVPNITLALSIFKFDRMEWAIEKCTELGVEQIIPVIAARTEAHLIVAAVKRFDAGSETAFFNLIGSKICGGELRRDCSAACRAIRCQRSVRLIAATIR